MRLISIVLLWCVAFMAPLTTHAGDGQDDAGNKAAEDRSNGELKRPPSALTDEQLWDIYYETLAKLKPHGIPADREEHKRKIKPEFRGWIISDDSHVAKYSVVLGTEKDIVFYVDADTGDVLSYERRDVFESGPPRVRPDQVPLGSKPKLKPAQVKEIAKKYLFLNTRMPLKEYEITVEYEVNSWYIRLQRTLGGPPIRVRHDLHGLFGEVRDLSDIRTISFPANATLTRRSPRKMLGLRQTSTSKPSWEELEQSGYEAVMGRGDKPDEHLLKIVNPAFAAKHTGRPWLDADITLDKARKTRLAWVFVYWSKSGHRLLMYVYIDAINGRPLGYHYMSLDEY